MPILGILASSITGGLVTDAGAMFPIRSYVVPSAGAASISWTSIPQTYSHLQIRWNGHSLGNAADYTSVKMLVNNDTGANYAYHRLYGNGASASADASTSQSQALATWVPDELNPSNYGVCIIDILDYANTNKYKTIKMLGGFDKNGAGLVAMFSGLWQSTSAITRLDFAPNNGQNFAQYTSIALYGVK